MDSSLKPWKECRPAGNKPFVFDLDSVDGYQVSQRRPAMEMYCNYLVPDPQKALEARREETYEATFKQAFKVGKKEVRYELIEYLNDKLVWMEYFSHLPIENRPVFPWLHVVTGNLSKTKMSSRYKQWLEAKEKDEKIEQLQQALDTNHTLSNILAALRGCVSQVEAAAESQLSVYFQPTKRRRLGPDDEQRNPAKGTDSST